MSSRAAFAAALLALAGCSDAATVELAAACKPENEGMRVRIEGVLRTPYAALCRTADQAGARATTCSFDLRENAGGGARLSLNLAAGAGPSRVEEAGLRATPAAARALDEDQRPLADGDRVRVTGVLRSAPHALAPGQQLCWLDVDKIERR